MVCRKIRPVMHAFAFVRHDVTNEKNREMSWCYAFMQNWLSASRLMVRLYLENDWSKAMCAYVTASLLIMADSPSISTGDLRFTVDELMG